MKLNEQMITGELKNKIDKIWNDFWTGGISNPLTVIEQFTIRCQTNVGRKNRKFIRYF